MDSYVLWEKIEDAKKRECDDIEIEDYDGKKIKIHIGKIGWYADYY